MTDLYYGFVFAVALAALVITGKVTAEGYLVWQMAFMAFSAILLAIMIIFHAWRNDTHGRHR